MIARQGFNENDGATETECRAKRENAACIQSGIRSYHNDDTDESDCRRDPSPQSNRFFEQQRCEYDDEERPREGNRIKLRDWHAELFGNGIETQKKSGRAK